jgi:hypothetical protein
MAAQASTASFAIPGPICEDRYCKSTLDISYCVDCSCHFCNSCWDKQPSHGEGKVARDRKPHEKIDYHIAKRLESILTPSNDREEILRMHEVDEISTWFGKLR